MTMATNGTNDRPDFATEAMLKFLDDTHAERRISMSAAPALLEDVFCLDYDEAMVLLAYWTGLRHSMTGTNDNKSD